MLEWIAKEVLAQDQLTGFLGLAATLAITSLFTLDWLRQFWRSPDNLSWLLARRDQRRADLRFRKALPSICAACALLFSAVLADEAFAIDTLPDVLLLASAPAGFTAVTVWFLDWPKFVIVPALRDVKDEAP